MGADVLEAAIRRTVVWFNVHHLSYCLVGGLAVSFRTIERATRDVDLAVGVQSEHQAENLIREIQNIGFTPVELLQRRSNGAISTVRLLSAEFRADSALKEICARCCETLYLRSAPEFRVEKMRYALNQPQD